MGTQSTWGHIWNDNVLHQPAVVPSLNDLLLVKPQDSSRDLSAVIANNMHIPESLQIDYGAQQNATQQNNDYTTRRNPTQHGALAQSRRFFSVVSVVARRCG